MVASRKFRPFIIASGLIVSGLSCDNGPSEPLVSLAITPINPVLLVGGSFQARVTIPAGSTIAQSGDTAWSSSAPSVIAVDASGLITAESAGSVTISVTIGSASGQFVVNAGNPSVGIQAKDRVTCGIVTNGDAYCWGSNALGQAGTGTTGTVVANPSKVVNISAFSTISPGGAHTCGTTESGATYCWGCNSEGELGNGSSAYTEGNSGTCGTVQASPVKVSSSATFADVEAASSILQSGQSSICSDAVCLARTCAVDASGQLYCWGQLTTTPVAVSSSPKLKSVSLHMNRGCGIGLDQTLYCFPIAWTGGPASIQPTAVLPETKMQAVSVGRFHFCAIDLAGRAYCAGANIRGELGSPSNEICARRIYGQYACRSALDSVSGGLRFQSISAGGGTLANSDNAPVSHTCGVTVQQDIYCWGDNEYGQLGNGTQTSSSTPVKIASDLKFRSVTTAQLYTCAVTVNGAGYCWGGLVGNQYLPPASPVVTPALVSNSLVFK